MPRTSTLTRAPVVPVDPIEALLCEIVAEQAQQRATLATILRLLERGRGPRDLADEVLVGVIALVSGGLPITAAALWRRRDAGDEALAAALARCDVDNPIQLGKLLKRLEGRDVDGWRLVRVSTNREGIIWRAARVQE